MGFISFALLLGLFYLNDRELHPEFKRKLGVGVLSVIVMTVIGFVGAELRLSIPIVKLALMRSTDLIVIIGLPIVIKGLLARIYDWRWYLVPVPVLLFFSSFIIPIKFRAKT